MATADTPAPSALRALIERATPGPWQTGDSEDDLLSIWVDDMDAGDDGRSIYRREDIATLADTPRDEANAALIVAAVNSLEPLLARIEALERERDGAVSRAKALTNAIKNGNALNDVPDLIVFLIDRLVGHHGESESAHWNSAGRGIAANLKALAEQG